MRILKHNFNPWPHPALETTRQHHSMQEACCQPGVHSVINDGTQFLSRDANACTPGVGPGKAQLPFGIEIPEIG